MVSTQDLLYLISSLAILFVAVFLCWALFEAARFLHQANAVLEEVRERLSRIERLALAIKEKFESSANYLGFIVEGAKALLGMVQRRKEKRQLKRKRLEE